MVKIEVIILILCFCLYTAPPIYSQDYYETHSVFNELDGFNLHKTECLVSDRDGFLWICGSRNDNNPVVKGPNQTVLQMFDGQKFKAIDLKIFDERITSITQILKLSESEFLMKAATSEGAMAIKINPNTLEHHEIRLPKTIGISRFVSYKNSTYFLSKESRSSPTQLYKVNDQLEFELIFETNIFDDSLPDKETKLLLTPDYILISGYHHPLTFFDWNGKELNHYTPKTMTPSKAYFEDDYINEIITQDENVFVIFKNTNGVFSVDPENLGFSKIAGNFKSNNYSNASVSLSRDNKNKSVIIISDEDFGLNRYEIRKDSLILNHHIDLSSKFNGIQTYSSNHDEGYWLTNDQGELHHFKIPNQKIKRHLDGHSIRAIHDFGDDFLIATERGWYSFDPIKDLVKTYEIYENGRTVIPISSRNFIEMNDQIWTNNGSEIICLNPMDHHVKSYKNATVNCMEQLNDSIFFYGTDGKGMWSFNVNNKKHSVLVDLDSINFVDLAIGKDFVLCAADKGIYSYRLDDGEFALLHLDQTTVDPYALMVDFYKDKGFFIGMRNGQLLNLKSIHDNLEILYEDDFNSGIATLLIDDEYFWINTFNGIVKWNLTSDVKERFSVNDGLSNNENNRYSLYHNPSSILCGTADGFSYFEKSDLSKEQETTEVMLLEIQKYDLPSDKFIQNSNRDEINSWKSIDIPAEQRSVKITTGIKNGLNNRYVRFGYKLNEQEYSLDKSNIINLVGLTPDEYDLEIFAYNFSNELIGQKIHLRLNVLDYFYNSSWFQILLIATIICILLYVIYQIQHNYNRQRQFSQNLIESEETLRTSIASNLHDGLGQQLIIINKKALDAAENEISNLTKTALNDLRSISKDLYPEILNQLGLKVSIESMIDKMDAESEMFFTYHIEDIDDLVNEKTALNIYRIVQESINNAVKHSNASESYISIEKKKKFIDIQVVDNGEGFRLDKNKTNSGIGLRILEERSKIINGQFEINTGQNQGTIIHVIIPIK